MVVLVKKASDVQWYDFREVNTIENVLEIAESVIVEPNDWDSIAAKAIYTDVREEDLSKFDEAKIKITIYDDYLE